MMSTIDDVVPDGHAPAFKRAQGICESEEFVCVNLSKTMCLGPWLTHTPPAFQAQLPDVA